MAIKIRRKLVGEADSAYTLIATLPDTATSFSDTGGEPETPYYYQFLREGTGGTWEPVAISATTPAAVAQPTEGDFKLWVVGDSIMSEDYGTPSTPTMIATNYSSNPNFKGLVSRAQSGGTIRDLINLLNAQPFVYDPNVTTYALVEVGVNDFGVGARTEGNTVAANIAQAKADLLELFNKLRAYGPNVRPIASTIISAGVITAQYPNPAVEAAQIERIQRFNTDMRQTFASYLNAWGVADRHSDLAFDQLGDTANTTYYSDRVHLTQAGKARDKNVWVSALNSALAGNKVVVQGERDLEVKLDFVPFNSLYLEPNAFTLSGSSIEKWYDYSQDDNDFLPVGSGRAVSEGGLAVFNDQSDVLKSTHAWASAPVAQLSVFIRLIAGPANGIRWFVGSYIADTNKVSWGVYCDNSQFMVLVSGDGTESNIKLYSIPYSDLECTIGFIFNAGVLKPYRDGVEIPVVPVAGLDAAVASIYGNGQPMTIGNPMDSTGQILPAWPSTNFTLKKVAIKKGVATAEEIALV